MTKLEELKKVMDDARAAWGAYKAARVKHAAWVKYTAARDAYKAALKEEE